jgi:hypothetical protein
MAQALPAGIPRLEETRHSRESIVEALRSSAKTPASEIAFGTVHAATIEPDILAVLDRALRQDLDTPDQRLLFRGIHILGGRQLSAAFRPFVEFLRGPFDRVEMFGDAITETLAKILAGLFDGSDEPLRALIVDQKVDPFVRSAGLRAMGTLCFDRRIDREKFTAFLRQLDEARLLADDDDILWNAWMCVIGVLGMTDLAEQVRTAFADGRIEPSMCSEKDFDRLLDEALARPDDRGRLDGEQMGVVEDVLAELETYPPWNDPENEVTDEDLLDWAAEDLALHPVRNPFRNVGRNDPCPCGSGKKFKKCCLLTDSGADDAVA